MFESVAPEKFAPRSRKIFYETLPLSIAIHALIVVGIAGAHIWDVSFPTQTPKLVMLYRLEEAPAPPPPPPPPPPPAQARPAVRPVPRNLEVAPTAIPEEIPVIQQQAENAPPDLPVDPNAVYVDGVEGGVEGGVSGGELGGQLGGAIGGTLGGVVTEDAPPPDTVVVKRDMPLPTAPMSMVFPKYPEEARVRGWEDRVIVRYVIGKDGRVREVTVLSRPDRELFEKITVKAIRNWRFRPYKKDGVAQEVVHELTIYFKLEA